jgi:micrococcal nuclease
VLVLVSSCGTRTLDTADTADKAEAEASGTADGVVGARSPPAVSATGNGHLVPADAENDWAPNAVVERVVDGDTIDVRIGDRLETVRLIGIDAPESVAPTRPVQCFGKEASLHLKDVLPEGTEITLVRDIEARDVYQRLLGYVMRSSDGMFVNLELVAGGYAAVLNYPPNDHYAGVLAGAEADAVAAGLGLWGHCGGPDVPLG